MSSTTRLCETPIGNAEESDHQDQTSNTRMLVAAQQKGATSISIDTRAKKSRGVVSTNIPKAEGGQLVMASLVTKCDLKKRLKRLQTKQHDQSKTLTRKNKSTNILLQPQ